MDLSLLERRNSDSVREYVYQTLRNNIIYLDMKPGLNLTEKDIAQKLNVSRTPVREAFIKLSHEDLVEIYPQKGTTVSLIDLGHVDEARFIRRNLENATVQLACTQFPDSTLFELQSNINSMEFLINEKNNNNRMLFSLDEEFHRVIFKGCRKDRSWSIIKQVSTHLDRVRYLKMISSENVWCNALQQHKNIVNAIKSKDVEYGVKSIEEHLGKIDMELTAIKLLNESYFK